MRVCSVEGCNGKHEAKGLCTKHYARMKKTGTLDIIVPKENEYCIHEHFAEIFLYNRKGEIVNKAIIDLEDVNKCKSYKWFVKNSDRENETPYVRAFNKTINKAMNLHRYVMNVHKIDFKQIQVDHINHNGLDCRKNNLRLANQRQNSFNLKTRRKGTSKYKGVFWSKNANRWSAQIKVKEKRTHLGYFSNEIDAAIAYDKAAKKAFGEYACTNNLLR